MINDIILPDYSRKEDWVNSATHMAGGVFAIIALLLCINRAIAAHSLRYLIVSIIYALSMIIVYTISSIYHALRPNKAKKLFRIIDHSAIYLLIAGSITPFSLIAIHSVSPVFGWAVFGIAWAAAASGIIFTCVGFERFKVIQMILYIAIGWAMLFAVKPLKESIGVPGIILMVAGGIVYTIGAVLYGLGKNRHYIHAIFHVFVLGGSILHFITIYKYILVV